MKKKGQALMILALFLAALFMGCAAGKEAPVVSSGENEKVSIVATLFPQYDFVRQIAGDKAEITLLLPPGVESHSYEPTPSDIIKINASDLFIFTGTNMEIWSQKIIDGMESSDSLVLDVSKGIDLVKTEEFEAEHHHEEEEGEEHDHYSDPHIWTDPLLAKAMVANILDALCQVDPSNADYYKENAERYSQELDELDAEFKTIVENGKRDEIIFGSRFALYYFTERYGLDYEAAFDSCSAESEPSAKTVAHLIDEIKEEHIPVIYYAEIAEPKVARSISEETGAKMLLFHSCHNVTKDELEDGVTYLSLMRQNAENLKEGLQ